MATPSTSGARPLSRLQSQQNVRQMIENLYASDSDSEDEIDIPVIRGEADILAREPTVQAPTNRDLPEDLEEDWVSEASPPLVQPFTGKSEVKIQTRDCKPIEFLQYFLSDELLQTWVDSTNAKAMSNYDVTYDISPHSRIQKWFDMT